MKYVIGIDEVGRGPLAGPVAVCALCFNKNKSKHLSKLFKVARDSKKLSSEKREEIFKEIKNAQKNNNIRYIVCYQNAKMIDKKGISFCIKKCIADCLKGLRLDPKKAEIFLDGGLYAPKHFLYQKTVIKGDDKIKAISLASIVAKVSRDNLMRKFSKKIPGYGFHVHKGYGTKSHKMAIQRLGLTPLHRKSWIH